MSIYQCVSAVVLSFALVACGSSTDETSNDEVDDDSSAQSSLDALPDKDSEGVNLCAVLPGDSVAAAIELTLLDTTVGPLGINRCAYFVGNNWRIDVAITDRMSFDAVRAVAEGFDKTVDDLAGIGVAAYTKESADGSREVWAARADGLYLSVGAHEQDWAVAVARLAMQEIP